MKIPKKIFIYFFLGGGGGGGGGVDVNEELMIFVTIQ